MQNPMTVSPTSDLAMNLFLLVERHQPKKIVETGTYLGMGTTAIIASALEDAVPDAEFHTIEVNADCVALARENLRGSGLDRGVTVHHGLSIPRSLLPNAREIQTTTVDRVKAMTDAGIRIAYEHHESDRTLRYYSETADETIPDDLLGQVLTGFGERPDLVLLDSAGHMGFVEFEYVVERLAGPCWIVLDDVFHIKHYDSFGMMAADRRFDVRCVSREKYGYAIARFEPA